MCQLITSDLLNKDKVLARKNFTTVISLEKLKQFIATESEKS